MRMKTIGAALALALTLGLAGAGSASASQPASTDRAPAGAVPVRAAVACTTAAIPSYYYAQDVFVEPNECRKCQDAGAHWENKGGYKAICKHSPNTSYKTAWLFIFCQKCREATPAGGQHETIPAAGVAGA
jgi:hypothetical protein